MNKRFEYLTVSLTSDEKTKELIFYIAEQKFLYLHV